MRISIPSERRADETRVAAVPDTVKKLVGLGAEVVVETGAGAGVNIPDQAFAEAGALIAPDEAATLAEADVVFKVRRPLSVAEGGPDELAMMKEGALLVALLEPHSSGEQIKAYADAGIVAFALELMPRISRAQSMDALSSQSNLAGYRAVIDAAQAFGRTLPMMMTAAGTMAPARVFVLGAGVAGLQAIATARRLGAIVSATDVRPAVREEIVSLGAKFVGLEDAEDSQAQSEGGYAREMSEDYLRRQSELVHETLKGQDIAICTALIPGRPAPLLISEAMVSDMKAGSVIVDLAVEAGGNCALSRPGEVVEVDGVLILGHLNVPGRIPVDASAMYAKNLLNFITPLIDAESGTLAIDWDDEIVAGTLITRDGAVVHPILIAEQDD
ncbi:MAG: Re/Si-specific NAD(P)(+) transhydrogenase subunit alpha [Alphaproteobacteria bacterium]